MVTQVKAVICVLFLGLLMLGLTSAEENSVFMDSEKAKSFHRNKRYVNIQAELRRESNEANERTRQLCRSYGKRHCPSRYGGNCC